MLGGRRYIGKYPTIDAPRRYSVVEGHAADRGIAGWRGKSYDLVVDSALDREVLGDIGLLDCSPADRFVFGIGGFRRLRGMTDTPAARWIGAVPSRATMIIWC